MAEVVRLNEAHPSLLLCKCLFKVVYCKLYVYMQSVILRNMCFFAGIL